jgi:mycobactin lysine-N-oxygenase
VLEPDVPTRHACGALVLTGPGVHRPLPADPRAMSRIFHCDSRRVELARIPIDGNARIAIVGGGESALSAVAFLRAFRPDAVLTVYTPTLPLSRGESFLENRVFSDPDAVGWSSLDERTRRDFVKHCDRGVFDAGGLAAIAYDEGARFVTGRVLRVSALAPEHGVCVDYEAAGEILGARHDHVVNCTGFDLLEQLRSLFPALQRAELEHRVGPLWDRPAGAEVPLGRNLELFGMSPRLHIPGLAALSQGPGFANLGCLGLLANRVLEPLVQVPSGPLPKLDSRRAGEDPPAANGHRRAGIRP